MITCILCLLLLPLLLFICSKKIPQQPSKEKVNLSKETKQQNLNSKCKTNSLKAAPKQISTTPKMAGRKSQPKTKSRSVPKEERSPDPPDALLAHLDPSGDAFPNTPSDAANKDKVKEAGAKGSEKKDGKGKKVKDTKTAQSPKVTAEGSGSKRDASTMWFVSQKQDAPKALFEEETQLQTDKTFSSSVRSADRRNPK